jgi:hypothetical protein
VIISTSQLRYCLYLHDVSTSIQVSSAFGDALYHTFKNINQVSYL